jgi:hypothetical protein
VKHFVGKGVGLTLGPELPLGQLPEVGFGVEGQVVGTGVGKFCVVSFDLQVALSIRSLISWRFLFALATSSGILFTFGFTGTIFSFCETHLSLRVILTLTVGLEAGCITRVYGFSRGSGG